MRSPSPLLSSLLAGILLLASGRAGGREAAPAGDDVLPVDVGPRLSTLLEAARGRATVEPRPALPAPRGGAPAGAAARGAGIPPGLSARPEGGGTAVEFPLVHTRVYAQVSGNVARVEVTQIYRNPIASRVEATYAFPLPANAAVTDMSFRIGKRIVLSEVRPRAEARQAYEAARREGKTAALTEQERPNLFTQSVANVPPGETVAVLLRYVHEVPFDDGRYAFVFPMTIGPRYVPGTATGPERDGWSPDTDRVPDASRITPPVLPTGFRSTADVDVMVRLTPGGAFADVAARSHRIVTGLDGDGGRLVALAEDDRLPSKDLVLSWRPASPEPEARLLVQREKGEDWLMLFVQPPVDVEPSMVRPKEVVFLLDKSGSMMGAPIETAKAVIAKALHGLGPDDTFQLIAFASGTDAMTDRPMPSSPENVAAAERWLRSLSGSGGTEMLSGILAALRPSGDPRRLRMVVFCTDGFIGNEEEIVRAVERTRGDARVFAFGIGSSVNRFLVEGVARAGRGAAEVVSVRERPDEAVARLFRRLDRPVLTDLSLSFEGGTASDLEPERLPDLFAGQPLVVVGRAGRTPPSHAVLDGRLGSRSWRRRLAVETAPAAPGAAVLGTLWARRRIDELENAPPPGVDPRAAVEEVVSLATRFKLLTHHTSFVAVERELLVDPGLPLARILVPSELPDGVAYEGIFGPAADVKVTPGRVKPGDPEIRVAGSPTLRAVRVALPFEAAPRDAVLDPASGDFVLRFLVPSGLPDGSYGARLTLIHEGGRTEERTAPIRVDTTPAAVAVLSAPASVPPGGRISLAMKPALPLARAATAAAGPGGAADALKAAMEVKEILVRAPWGEVARARMEGPLGTWTAELGVPEGCRRGPAVLEIVASDAAGNVSRRHLEIAVGDTPAAGRGAVATLAAVLLGGLGLGLRRRARRGAAPAA